MAKKIAVISSYGVKPTGEYLKKSVAELEVRRLLADWVVRGSSIRRRKIEEIKLSAIPRYRHQAPRTYIPAILPPIEIPGIHLEAPKNCEGVSMAAIRANWNWNEPQAISA